MSNATPLNEDQSMFNSADRERGFAPGGEFLDSSIFNLTKDYDQDNGSFFLQQPPGLLDTINPRNERIEELYKKLKSLDWDENEFAYWECLTEFETGDKDDIDMMIATLAWQWEADSVAANNISALFAPFVTNAGLWDAYVQINQNEIVHGRTYSEIVKNSFRDAKGAMAKVLENVEAQRRLTVIGKVFAEGKRVGAMITLGQIDRNSDLARDTVMKMVFAMLGLERGQFMPSFAITFAFGEVGRFMPIAKAVQKICNEEYSIHVEIGKEVIRNELSTEVGRASFERIKDDVSKMYVELIESEINWNRNHLFVNGRTLTGCTVEMVEDYILYGANDLFTIAGLPNPFRKVTKLPIEYMADWIDVDKNQASAQEEKTGNYLLGGFVQNSDGKIFDTEGL